MDKLLVGKWYWEVAGQTLNVLSEEPLRIKCSFSDSGYYNCEPNCAYFENDRLCFEYNDEEHRAITRVKYVDGKLVGTLTQYGNETAVTYLQQSEEPEDGEFRYVPFEFVTGTQIRRADILKEYAEYGNDRRAEPYETEYVLGGEKPDILGKYDYDSYVEGKSGDEIAFALLSFVCDHFKHHGGNGLAQDRSITGLIKFCENLNMSTNCRGLAMLLASLLRMNGIKARHITCMPYEQPFNDCHVVVDCLLPSGARVMLDPTYRLYLKDGKGEYVSLPRLREMLISEEEYFPNEGAGYNGGGFDIGEHRAYMTKNTLRFSRGTLCIDGHDDHFRRTVQLVPKGYPPEDKGFSDSDKAEFVFDDLEFWAM